MMKMTRLTACSPDADANADATTSTPPIGSSNSSSSRKRAKYTKTFPTIVDHDESVRYYSTSLNKNLFNNASEVEQVLTEIAQKELQNDTTDDKNASLSSSPRVQVLLGGSLSCGRWSDTRQVDGLRFLIRQCPFFHKCGCTWRVKVCHNTKTNSYFIVLPIVPHQIQLHHNNNTSTSSTSDSKKKKKPSPKRQQQKEQYNASDAENISSPQTKQLHVLGIKSHVHDEPKVNAQTTSNSGLNDLATTTTTTTEAKSPQQQQVVPLLGVEDQTTRIETKSVLEKEETAKNSLNIDDDKEQQKKDVCRAAKTANCDDHDDSSLPTTTKTAPVEQALATANIDNSIDVDSSQLAQLASMTLLGIDTGNLQLIQDFIKDCCCSEAAATAAAAAANGDIVMTNVTTDPLFAAQQATMLEGEQKTIGNNNDDSSSSSLIMYTQMLYSTVAYAQNEKLLSKSETIAMAMDRLAVHLGKVIMSQILLPAASSGDVANGGGGDNANHYYYISTRVDPRLAFDTAAMIHRARCISQLYQSIGISKEHVLIQLAATWEGIMAAYELETRHGLHCQLSLIFSTVQAHACAQYNVHVITPHPSDITAYWHRHHATTNPVATARSKNQASSSSAAANHGNNVDDIMDKPTTAATLLVDATTFGEGVRVCREIYHHVCRYGHDTICVPVIGTINTDDQQKNNDDDDDDDDVDCLNEIRALAGIDRMIIPIPLMRKLATCHEPLKQQLHPPANRINTANKKKTTTTTTSPAATRRTSPAPKPPPPVVKTPPVTALVRSQHHPLDKARMTQQEFRYRLNMDVCGTELLALGIRAWIKDVERLEKIITTKVQEAKAK